MILKKQTVLKKSQKSIEKTRYLKEFLEGHRKELKEARDSLVKNAKVKTIEERQIMKNNLKTFRWQVL